MLKVGVIGCGDMGLVHATHLAHQVPGAELAAIMDTSPERMRLVTEQCEQVRTFTDARALINDASVQAVVIASPDPTHAELVLECLAADKPVLCEKPLSTTLESASHILESEVKKNRRLLQVGFMREYDEAHQRVKAALADKTLGRRLMIRTRAVNPSKDMARPVDVVVTNSAIHDLHTVRWLMEDEIEQVYVQYYPYEGQPGTCRLMNLSLTFQSGALGNILINSECGYGHEVDVEITTERGQINSGGTTEPIVRQHDSQSLAVYPSWRERFMLAYLNEITEWVTSLARGAPTGPGAWDGYRSLVVSEAAIESATCGQPVNVPSSPKPALYD